MNSIIFVLHLILRPYRTLILERLLLAILLHNCALIEIFITSGGTGFIFNRNLIIMTTKRIIHLLLSSWTDIFLLLLRFLHLICIIFVIDLIFNITLLINLSSKWFFFLRCSSLWWIRALYYWIDIKCIQFAQSVLIVNTILIIILIPWLLSLIIWWSIVSVLVHWYFELRFQYFGFWSDLDWLLISCHFPVLGLVLHAIACVWIWLVRVWVVLRIYWYVIRLAEGMRVLLARIFVWLLSIEPILRRIRSPIVILSPLISSWI